MPRRRAPLSTLRLPQVPPVLTRSPLEPGAAYFEAGALPRLAPLSGEARGAYLSRCLAALLPPGDLESLTLYPQHGGHFTLVLQAETLRVVRVTAVVQALEACLPGLSRAVLWEVQCALRFPVWGAEDVWFWYRELYEFGDFDVRDPGDAEPRHEEPWITPEALRLELGATPRGLPDVVWTVPEAQPLRAWLLHLKVLLSRFPRPQDSLWETDDNAPPALRFEYGGAELAAQLYEEVRSEDMFSEDYTLTHHIPEPESLPGALRELHVEHAALEALITHLECEDLAAPRFPEPSELQVPDVEALHEISLEDFTAYWVPGEPGKAHRPARPAVLECIAQLGLPGDTPQPSAEALLF